MTKFKSILELKSRLYCELAVEPQIIWRSHKNKKYLKINFIINIKNDFRLQTLYES